METAYSPTSGRLLACNIVWNLMGNGLPMLVAILIIPVIITGLGVERFGLLAVIWTAIGYFGLFDFGIGRALTQLVSVRLANQKSGEILPLVVTAITLMGGLGLMAAGCVAFISPWLVTEVLNVPLKLQMEATYAFWIMAGSLPFVILSVGIRGILEAHQCFKGISLVRGFLGIITFLAPLLVMQWTKSLALITAFLAVARIFSTVAYIIQCERYIPFRGKDLRVKRELIKPLLSFGGWLTVSNIISPIMNNLDRLLIGSILTLTAVTYYTTPYEVVTRLLIIPGALSGVLFPAFTAALVTQQNRLEVLFRHANFVVLLGVAPPIALIMLFAPEGLTFWINQDFAIESTAVLRWLAIGVLVNSVARLPFAIVQSAGRPDITAKIHISELPVYLLLLWILLQTFGVAGAAMVWTIRVIVDAVLLFIFSTRFVTNIGPLVLRTLGLITLVTGIISLLSLPTNFALKIGLAVTILVVSVLLAIWELNSSGIFRKILTLKIRPTTISG